MAEQEKLIMANKTVLVIEDEDNEMNMKLARSLLKLGGYEVPGLIPGWWGRFCGYWARKW